MPSQQTSDKVLTIENKKPLVILIGAPGSGKGTQAVKLVEAYGITHISTGDMLRAEMKKESAIGKEAKKYIDQGQLVPDSVIISMLKERMNEKDCEKGVLLDGFPRTVSQAKTLQEMVQSTYGTKVLFLDVDDESVVKRISGRRSCPSCGSVYHVSFNPPQKENICDKCSTGLVTRNDDTESTVRARLNVFHEQTAPVVSFYKDLGVLTVINGEQSPEQVTKDTFAALQ